MITFHIIGWNADMHTQTTDVTVSKRVPIAEGISENVTYSFSLSSYYPDWGEDLLKACAAKLKEAKLITDYHQLSATM